MVDIITKKHLLYEPRALWARQAYSVSANPPFRDSAYSTNPSVILPRGHFTNGSRYPYELTHITLAPLGNTLRATNLEDPVTTAGIQPFQRTYRNDMGNLSEINLFIRAPKRSQLMIKPVAGRAFGNTLAYGQQAIGVGNSSSTWESSLFGLHSWQFERSLRLPRDGTVQFALGASWLPAPGQSNVAQQQPQAAYMFFSHGIKDGRGRFGSEGRVKRNFFVRVVNGNTAPNAAVWPIGALCAQPDSFGVANAGTFPAAPGAWPSQHEFSPREWLEQEATRGGVGSHIDGFAVCVNQSEFDNRFFNAFSGDIPDMRIAPLEFTTRARTKDAGTGEWWWRPGAPLSLVTPSCTEALVHKLDKPIVLGPGEDVEVEVKFPEFTSGFVYPGTQFPAQPQYQIGVSLTGYAVVEG